MPDGISCNAVFWPPITSVCPALWPPESGQHLAHDLSTSRRLAFSFITPLSTDYYYVSGHIYLLIFAYSFHIPVSVFGFANQLAIANEFVMFGFGARQFENDQLTRFSQFPDCLTAFFIVVPGSENRAPFFRRGPRVLPVHANPWKNPLPDGNARRLRQHDRNDHHAQAHSAVPEHKRQT